ncbi:MAG: polysaccharide biosynthesis tyrosine autokinase [Halioglobus sp.]
MQAHNLPTPFSHGDESTIDLQHYWRVVRQSWKGILGLCLVVSMLAALWVMRIAPVYRASATIMIEAQQANTVSIQEVYSRPYRNYQYFSTQWEIIRNRDIAELAANKLDLWNHPTFSPPKVEEGSESDANESGFTLDIRGWLSGLFTTAADKKEAATKAVVIDSEELRRAAVINRILGGLSVEPVQYTQLGRVSFESTDRILTAQVANAVAQVYIQDQMDSKMESTQEAGEWLSSRLGDLKANLDTSQVSLQEFRDKEEILDVAGGQTLRVQELNELNTRLGEARRTRMEIENIYSELDNSTNFSMSQLMSMPTVLQHPLVQGLAQSLTEAQQNVANLGKRYGPEHPRMMTANAQKESVEYELKEQLRQVATTVEAEYRVAQRNEQQVAQQLATVKQDVAGLNRKEFRLRELERQVETDQRLYEIFLTRSRETTQATGFQAAHARIVEKAVPPFGPIRPNKQRTVLLAFILSAILGVGLAILRDLLDKTLKSADDVTDRLDAPLLGSLPNIKLNKSHSGPYLGYMDDATSTFAEAVRSLRTGLVLSGLEKPHKITIVTSTNPGEGKSTVSINLASALAQMESVLLIDADLRRPSIAKAFELPSGAPGLSNVLAKSDPLEACIHKTEAGFDVLPAGIVPANPLEMLSTSQFKALLKDLAQKYERVIVDSAPLNMVSDSLILATLADSLVYVAKADSTPHRLVQKHIDLIKHSNLPLTGVVLNRVDAKKQGAYYGKDGYYNNYYTYGQS